VKWRKNKSFDQTFSKVWPPAGSPKAKKPSIEVRHNSRRQQMKRLKEIQKHLRTHKKELKKNYKVKEIGIFGSYIRGDQKEKSDLDILVDFDETIGLFRFVSLERYLSRILGVKVDLVMKSALKPRIGKRILNEVRFI
jgi:predicted nucleotidyltransferase